MSCVFKPSLVPPVSCVCVLLVAPADHSANSDISTVNQPFSGQLEPRTITASEEEKLRNDCRTGVSCPPANQTQLTTKYGETEQTAGERFSQTNARIYWTKQADSTLPRYNPRQGAGHAAGERLS